MASRPHDSELDDDVVTRPVARAQQGLEILSVALVVVDGPSRGTRVVVEDGAARVGTAAGSDLRLADPLVSRVHCEIRVGPHTILVRDSGSLNGTLSTSRSTEGRFV